MAAILSTVGITKSRQNHPVGFHFLPNRHVSFVWGLCAASILLFIITGCGGGGDDSDGNATPPPPPVPFSTFQSASVVIGQSDFTSGLANRGTGPNSNTINNPSGNAAVGSLFVPDYANHRVLRYTTVPPTNGVSANVVLGQPDFTTTDIIASATGMSGPQTAVISQGKLLVVDRDFHRVLIWNSVPTTTQTPANVVVGQPNMTTTNAGCTASNLDSPESIGVFDGSLVVADSNNNRILAWNTIPTTNGAPADYVVGQPNFTTCALNPPSNMSLNHPTDVTYNGAELAIADAGNNRLLIFSTVPDCAPTPCAITTPPNIVFGQPDFNSNNPGVGPTSLNFPYFLSTPRPGLPPRLALADRNNNRVLIWELYPSCVPPDTTCSSIVGPGYILGQPNNSSNTANNDGMGGSLTSAQSLSSPTGVFFNGTNQLIVTDSGNNRYLIFNAQ